MTTQLPRFLHSIRTVRSRAQLSPLGPTFALRSSLRKAPARYVSPARTIGVPAFAPASSEGESISSRLFAPGLLDRLQMPLTRHRE
jgi:hypothetical protein